MNTNEQLLMLSSDLRTPLNDPAAPTDWKDWYHFVMMDPISKTRLLANVSLSGIPGCGQVIVSMIVISPRFSGVASSFGFVDDYEWSKGMVDRGPTRITGQKFTWQLTGKECMVAFEDKDQLFCLEFSGETATMPILIPEFSPFGSGFIGWAITPQVRVEGRVRVNNTEIDINRDWYCYHDHNYGRFRWGEDVGWIWFVAYVLDQQGSKFSLILHRGNNRDQTECGAPYLFIFLNGKLKKVFSGAAVFLEWQWSGTGQRPARLPGSMATLFAERTVVLPEGLKLWAADEVDSIHLELKNEDLTELVVADNTRRQYTFIDEMTGKASMGCKLQTHRHECEGLFYAEFVY